MGNAPDTSEALGHRLTGLASLVGPRIAAAWLGRELRVLRRRAGGEPLVCGPFLGEPGFETLYWIPFLRRLLAPVLAAGGEATVISRGGAEPLYADLIGRGARYLDALDVMEAEQFLRLENERSLVAPMERNQKTGIGQMDARILEEAGLAAADPVLPSDMFRLLSRYRDEEVCDWSGWPETPPIAGREDVTVLKLWFGGQLPATPEILARLERLIAALAEEGRVVALDNPHSLEVHTRIDDPFDTLIEKMGIETWSTTSPRTNIAEQAAFMSRGRRLVSTYGGLAYLSLYTNTPLVAYYSDPTIVFSRHFVNFARAVSKRNDKAAVEALPVSLVDLGTAPVLP